MISISSRDIVSNTKVLIYYAFVLLAAGIIRNEVLLSTLNESVVGISRIVSHLTLIFNVLSSLAFLVIIYLLPFFAIKLLNIRIEIENYFSPFDMIINLLITNEIIKSFCLIFFFWDGIIENKNIIQEYKSSNVYIFDSRLDIFFTILCIGYWAFVIQKKENLYFKNTLYLLLMMILPIGLFFTVFHL